MGNNRKADQQLADKPSTTNRQAKGESPESESLYRMLVDNTREGIVIAMPDPLRLVFANPAMTRLLGYTVEELIALSTEGLTGLIHPQDRELFWGHFQDRIAGYDMPEACEVRGMRKDSTVIWLAVYSERMEHEGQSGMMAMFRDITKRNQAEREIHQTNAQLNKIRQELESSREQLLQSCKLAAVGQLVSGVAHELNNPLMAISGTAELMLKYVKDKTTIADLETIFDDTERAINIVRNLLSFARKQEPKKRLVSVNEVVESVISLRFYEMRLGNIEILKELDPELPTTMADFQQLQQVFLNLLINAEQAMDKAHGKGCLAIRTQQAKKSIRVTFTDDGPGIPEEIHDKVFEPFFTTKEAGKGTGLGLSICYDIIQQHGGQISVKSIPDKGATFIVELPVAPAEVECLA